MADTHAQDLPGFTQQTLQAREDLTKNAKPKGSFVIGDLAVDLISGRDTLWMRVTRGEFGGVALRALFGQGEYSLGSVETTQTGLAFTADSHAGAWNVSIDGLSENLLRVQVKLTPAVDLLIPFWQRDLYPIDASGDPLGTKGEVEAAQRGFNTGLCYFCLDEPAFGAVLYLQNLTALNPYFRATATKPDGVVGGEWPELGYQPPAAPNGNSPPVAPLKAGEAYVVSDAFLAFRAECGKDETASARRFLDMVANIYPYLLPPEPAFHDWPERAAKTLHDLKSAPEATLQHYGYTYLHPYTASEYPDSMVQMSVASAIDEWEALTGKTEPYKATLLAGMGRFFDKELGTVRRYLPNVGDDKNANAVDSWYLYHPLMNLARLAIRGDAKSRELFVGSLDYAVKAARHFKYIWPIQYDVRDFAVITETRGDGYGQTDVAGLYAYLMLQAYQLTEDKTYLAEAKAAMKAAEGMRFELVYQSNLTAWGVAACIKLWRIEDDERYLAQAEVFLASFVHNSVLWDSEIEHAKAYSNFFGVTCLHDAPYLAAYECFESFSAFDEVLHYAGEDLPPTTKLLLSEFRRFAFDRSWAYYPDALPEEAIAQDGIRNGHIDRNLSFPLEDLYADGQPAGQVGQEIYGCGGAFIIAARGFYQESIPFRLHVDYPFSVDRNGNSLRVSVKGPSDYTARVRLLPSADKPLPEIRAQSVAPQPQKFRMRKGEGGGRRFDAPAEGVMVLSWH